MRILNILMISVLMLGTALSAEKADTETHKVVVVKTAEEFVKAIGPDRIIKLQAGDYNLTKVPRGKYKHVYWKLTFGENEHNLIIRDVTGLTIIGEGKTPAHIQIDTFYPNVLNFEKCSIIRLENLKLGHSGYCTGGVVSAVDSSKFSIHRCVLYGCGIEGLNLLRVKEFKFSDSIIEDCTYGIMRIEDSESLTFTNSKFRNNRKFYGCVFTDIKRILFQGGEFSNNQIAEPLFQFRSNKHKCILFLKKCEIIGNGAHSLAATGRGVAHKDTKIVNNSWQAPDEIKNRRGKKIPFMPGGWHYYTKPGETEYFDISISVYGRGNYSDALKLANPDIKQKDLKVDTKIFCPLKPEKNKKR